MAEDQQQNNNLTVSERILKLRKKILELEERGLEISEDEKKLLSKSEGDLAKLVKLQEKRLKLAFNNRQEQLDLDSTFKSQIQSISSMTSVYDGLKNIQQKSLELSQQSLSSVQQQLLEDEDKKTILDSTLSGVSELQSLQKQIAETGPEDVEAQASLNAQYKAQMNKLEESIARKKMMGELTEDEADALAKVLEYQTESLAMAQKYGQMSSQTKDIIESQIDAYKGVETAIRGVMNTVETLIKTPQAIAGSLLIGLGEVVGRAGELNKTLGLGVTDIGEMQVSAVALGFAFENANEVATELASTFGTMNAGFDLQLQTNLLATNLGLATNEAVDLTKAFSSLNQGSTDVAADMMVSVRETAKLNGVIPSKVMKDLANNTEAFALFGKEGGKNIAEAAVYAQKLGVTMDKLTGIADNLLDFENSITAELELSAMLGRNINLDRARQLAYEDDIQGAVNETLNQLGGIEAFNQMDYYQKKQTAELLGVSVGELQKMAENQESLTGDVGLMQSGYSKLTESITAIGNTFAGTVMKGAGGFLITLGQVNMGLTAMGMPLNGIFTKLKGIVATSLTWLKTTLLSAAAWVKQTAVTGYNTVARWLNVGATTASITATNADTVAKNTSILTTVKERVATMGATVAKYASAAATTSWTAITKVSNALMNLSILGWMKEKAAIVASTVVKWGYIAATSAWNAVMGISNAIKSSSIAKWVVEKGLIVASTVAKWLNVGATAAVSAANTTMAVSQTAVATTAAPAAGGISAFGAALGAFGVSAAPAIPIILAIAGAILLATPALWVMGEVVKSIAQVIGNVLIKALEMIPDVVSSISEAFRGMMDSLSLDKIGLLFALAPALIVLAAALTVMGNPLAVAGIGTLFLLSYAITPFADAVSKLSGVDSSALMGIAQAILLIGSAVSLIGLALPLIIMGSVSLMALGLSLTPFTEALSKLQGVDITSVLSVSQAILLIGASLSLIGLISPGIIAGTVALIGMGFALKIFTNALSVLGGIDTEAMKATADSIGSFSIEIAKLGILSPLLIAGGIALGIMSFALYPFTAALQGLTSIDPTILETISKSLMDIGSAAMLISSSLGLAVIALMGIGVVFPLLLIGSIIFGAFGSSLMLVAMASMILAGTLPIVMASLKQMVDFTEGLLGLSDAILTLAGSMTSLSFASLMMVPLLPVIATIGAVSSLFGGGGEGGEAGAEDGGTLSSLESTVREVNEALLMEIKGLRDDLNSGKISVNMDGDKVTSKIVTNINRSASNGYGIK